MRTVCVPAIVVGLLVVALAVLQALAVAPGNEHFHRTWARTDQPVADGDLARTWVWAPEAFTPVLSEPYDDAPGGQRQVQYFDKARMEINDPDRDPASPFFVTNGLLVIELMSGNLQLGNERFEPHSPAQVNVAGDPDDPLTYADLAPLRDAPALADGSTITQTLDSNGVVGDDPGLASQGVTVASRVTVPGIDHQVASPFWNFLNSSGPVIVDGQLVTERLFDPWFYATGYPITEAYWATVKVGGTPRLVLLQCFERRCLTYTPGNPEGFVVEAGNVGQHYHRWRYEQIPGEGNGTATPTSTATATETASPTVTGTATATATEEPATEYNFAGKWGAEFTNTRLASPQMMAAAPGGEIYVTNTGLNQVLKFTSTGVLVTSWGGAGSDTGKFNAPIGIAVDENGNVYVADFGNDRVQKFDANGAFITAWDKGFDGTPLNGPYGLAIGPNSYLHVTESSDNLVQRYTLDGFPVGQWGVAGSGIGQFSAPQGIDVSPSGLVYVMDTGNSRVQIFDSVGDSQGSFGQAGSGEGQFGAASGLAVAGDGTVYVSDLAYSRVQRFTVVPEVAPARARTLAAVQYEYAGLLGEPGAFNSPIGLEIDAGGRVLVADTGNSRVQIYAQTGRGGPIGRPGQMTLVDSWTDANRARFQTPLDIAVGHDDRVYVVDFGTDNDETPSHHQIQVFSSNGVYLDRWLDLLARGITVDSQGNLLVANYLSRRIEKYSPDGELLGGWAPGDSSGLDPAGAKALAVDAEDNVYILYSLYTADGIGGTIQKFSPDGVVLDSWGALGSEPGRFNNPSGIAVHDGYVYVADAGNNRVQVFDLDGEFVREWGGPGSGAGQFDARQGIAVDPAGYVYVSAARDHRVQKFTPEGVFITQIGSPGSADGQFSRPHGIALDSKGNVYIADTGNWRIQKFAPVS